MRTSTLVLSGVLLFTMAVLAWKYLAEPSPEPVVSERAVAQSAPEESLPMDEHSGQSREPLQGRVIADEVKQGPKRIVMVPGEAPGDAPGKEAEPNADFQTKVQDSIELALEGDRAAAVRLAAILSRCNGFQRNWLSNLHRWEGRMPEGWEGWLVLDFETGEVLRLQGDALEAFIWKRDAQCQAIRDMTGDNLRERIKRLAERGVVTARYLYAVWPPEIPRGQNRLDYWADTLDYGNNALAFTWDNIDGGEPLGLLALGRSYSARRGSMFTPPDWIFGTLFSLAAQKCGLSSAWLDSEIQNSLEMGMRNTDDAEAFLQHLNTRAEEAAGVFCAAGTHGDARR